MAGTPWQNIQEHVPCYHGTPGKAQGPWILLQRVMALHQNGLSIIEETTEETSRWNILSLKEGTIPESSEDVPETL